MKFSMIFEAQLVDPTPERERQVIHDCVEQAVLAEEMGFDRIWAVEHHSLTRYAHMSASEIFLTWVAARTSTIRIGHGVVTMPFGYRHPVRVAERAAKLDVLSGGRVDIGPGAILPRPVQDPHPPLFMACSKHDTLKLAAELGIGALVMGFAGADDVRAMRKVYDEAIATRGGERLVSATPNDHFSALCPTIVLDDAERALRLGTRGRRPVDTGTYNAEHAYGSAETAIAYVEQLREIGVDEVMCLIQMGTVPQEACLETIRQWGEKVIPHFRALEA
ncbi:LLM class flavin-dependent oxidoreductase [Streptomyces katrae]|uniref:LLM class flavin-dependent oxidoreductase n=1 Tax=Streptomyces katrae TaxID=68223 RepID=A0ABT7GYB0_9ACTN|nr:LLM class flavin-dependent oxidoreductase [Streptomyces katrae]MDK9498388.1 LLM class flavin-dependent oxidoreductase [Streptomyces katrae]